MLSQCSKSKLVLHSARQYGNSSTGDAGVSIAPRVTAADERPEWRGSLDD